MNKRIDVALNSEVLENFENFKYLTAAIGANWGVKSIVSNRLNKECKMLGGMKNKRISGKVKLELNEWIFAHRVVNESAL